MLNIILSTLLLCASVNSQIFVGPKYQGQTALQKTSQVMGVVTNNTTPGKFPTLGLAELFLESMVTTFSTVADDMPLQFDGFQRRPKLIHSVGAIGLASWAATTNINYTGVFQGCSNLIVRFSCATAPSTGPKGYTPALSIKCLRSSVPSANMFGMYSLEGQDSWNFFKHDLTNHVPDFSTSASIILQEVRKAFETASSWPTMLGLRDFATYDQNGNSVTPKFPFRLIFHPVTAVRNMFPDTPSSTPFEQVIANTLNKPGPLYYVYAQDKPTDTQDQLILIGRIDLRAPVTTSNFGDNYLFYEHSRMEDDMELHPEWVAPAQALIKEQQNSDYWTFPDLPFN